MQGISSEEILSFQKKIYIFTEKRRANPPPFLILNLGLKFLFYQAITLYIFL